MNRRAFLASISASLLARSQKAAPTEHLVPGDVFTIAQVNALNGIPLRFSVVKFVPNTAWLGPHGIELWPKPETGDITIIVKPELS